MATFSPSSRAALETNQVLMPSMLGWSMASRMRGRSALNSASPTSRVVCRVPYTRATSSASGASSAASPRNSSKASVTV